MSLARPVRAGARVSLVPLIDVLFILLVYFMVTSVYLDLDMVPASPSGDAAATPPPAAGQGEAATTLLVRIDPAGQPVIRGRSFEMAGLEAALEGEMATRPGLEVVLLPSPHAPMQALASALDAIAGAGVTRSRVLRLEEAE
ncbi:MAG: biopolymer transporter ExbD [Pseudomonadota bacterium]